MQHRGVLVEADDVAVGQVVGVLAGGLAVGQVDAEFAGAGPERALGGAVRARADAAGLAHHRDLVRGLERAVVLQVGDDRRRVVGDVIAQRALRLAEDRAARRVGRQVARGVRGVAHHHDVEMVGPVAARRLGHHVPVVVRLQEHQLGPLPGGGDQPAAGRPGHRQPCLELRVHRVGIVTVVEGLVMQRAAGHHEVVEAAARERLRGAGEQGVEVRGIQGGGHGFRSRAG